MDRGSEKRVAIAGPSDPQRIRNRNYKARPFLKMSNFLELSAQPKSVPPSPIAPSPSPPPHPSSAGNALHIPARQADNGLAYFKGTHIQPGSAKFVVDLTMSDDDDDGDNGNDDHDSPNVTCKAESSTPAEPILESPAQESSEEEDELQDDDEEEEEQLAQEASRSRETRLEEDMEQDQLQNDTSLSSDEDYADEQYMDAAEDIHDVIDDDTEAAEPENRNDDALVSISDAMDEDTDHADQSRADTMGNDMEVDHDGSMLDRDDNNDNTTTGKQPSPQGMGSFILKNHRKKSSLVEQGATMERTGIITTQPPHDTLLQRSQDLGQESPTAPESTLQSLENNASNREQASVFKPPLNFQYNPLNASVQPTGNSNAESSHSSTPALPLPQSELNADPNHVTSVPDPKTLVDVDSESEDSRNASAVTSEYSPNSPAIEEMSLVSHDEVASSQMPSYHRRLLKTGYVYDIFMIYHASLDESEEHPEDPRRIFYIYHDIEKHGLLRDCTRIPIRKATRDEILTAHHRKHFRNMRSTQDMVNDRNGLVRLQNEYESIYLNCHSFESGLYAAGGVVEACKAVVRNQVKNAFAIVRPPGHHAEPDAAMGFCVFNNVAVATRHCMQSEGVKRILIVDWDVHFGNGTQRIFENDPNVLYVSLHRYENGTFYPGDTKGAINYVGGDQAKGRTVNIGWSCDGMTDGDYIYAFQHIILPIAMEFAPELVIVSAGFDAADGDHIGLCNVTPAGYGQMTHMLKSLAGGRLVLALEGGYNLNSISVSARACMAVLLGESPDPVLIHSPTSEGIKTIERVKRAHSRYWQSLERRA